MKIKWMIYWLIDWLIEKKEIKSLVSVKIWTLSSPSSVMLNFSFLKKKNGDWSRMKPMMIYMIGSTVTINSSFKLSFAVMVMIDGLTMLEWWGRRTRECPSFPNKFGSFRHTTPGYKSLPVHIDQHIFDNEYVLIIMTSKYFALNKMIQFLG